MEFRERKEKYQDIISNLNDGLNDLIERCKEKIDRQNEEDNPIISSQVPSCGSMNYNEEIPNSDLTSDELEALQETSEEEIEDIFDELNSENIDDELEKLSKEMGGSGVGEGQGDISGFMYVPKYTVPEWFDEIEAAVGSLIGEPDKGRAGTDYEEMQTYIEQGVMIVRRPKRMMLQESKEVYVLLDTSGSMSFNFYKGQSFLKLLGGFIPVLGEEYTGKYWVCDDCGMRAYKNPKKKVPNNSYNLESVNEKVLYEGGGGTSFDGAFAKLGAIERKKQQENPDYEMCVVFFSDMEIGYNEFTSYRDLGPSKIIFVTAKNNESELKKHPWIYESDKHKIVLIELENDRN